MLYQNEDIVNTLQDSQKPNMNTLNFSPELNPSVFQGKVLETESIFDDVTDQNIMDLLCLFLKI